MVEASRPAATNWRAGSESGRNDSLLFEPFERGVDRTSRHVALETCLHLLQNRATVGVFTEPHDSEKHRLFERTQSVSHLMPTL